MTQVVSLTKRGRFKIPIMMLAKYGKDRPARVTIKDLGAGWLVKLIPNDKKLNTKIRDRR